jgi:hypothetical protein
MPLTDLDRGASSSRGQTQADAPAKRKLARLSVVGVVVGLATALGCRRAEPPPSAAAATPTATAPAPKPTPAAGTPAPPPSADSKAAAAWIAALRERDPATVLAKTAVPFDFRDGSAKKKCPPRTATTRAAAAGIMSCLAKDETFHADLSGTPEPRLVEIDAGSLPAWAKAWTKTIRPGLRPISTFVHGEAEAREIVLLVGDDGVHGLWQNVVAEPQ